MSVENNTVGISSDEDIVKKEAERIQALYGENKKIPYGGHCSRRQGA